MEPYCTYLWNDSVGIASLLTDMKDTHLKPVNILCELWRTTHFPYYTYPFLIKYVQLNAPDVNLEKGLTNDKKSEDACFCNTLGINQKCLLHMHNYIGLSVHGRMI